MGSAAALLGDQFTIIAIPWLVLTLSNDSLVLGLVMACIGLPRVIFLLIAGVLVDRYSPRLILILSSLAGALVLVALGGLVLTHALTLWMLYAFAALMGLVGTFTIPARMSILPRIVDSTQLQSANSIMMGVNQIAVLAGPVLAGILISTSKGLGIAFLLNGICMLIAALTVPRLLSHILPGIEESKRVFSSIMEGIRWLWADRTLRVLVCYWTVAAFLAIGPVQVGLPRLVEQQLGMGSAAFGLLISVNGFGQLLGILLSSLRVLKAIPLGIAACLIDVAAGLAMVGMGVNHQLAISIALVFTIGTGAGFVQVGLYTWIQNRIPSQLLGRIISILTLIMTSTAPTSALLSGVFTHYVTIPMLFITVGISLASFALLSISSRAIRSVQSVPSTTDEAKSLEAGSREAGPAPIAREANATADG
nr:transporter [Dyella tabacisoli]